MIETIRNNVRKSRTERFCDLSEHVGNIDFPQGKLSFSDLRTLVNYQRNNRRIMPGDAYVCQFNKYEGETYTWRAHKGIYDLLCKYGLFPEYD